MQSKRNRFWIALACGLAGLAVALGAFGAHGLKEYLAEQVGSEMVAERLATWETAARYQMYHALALLAVGLMIDRSRAVRAAGILFVVGIVIFSGCLYALVLTNVRVLGAIVPIGGLAMIVGWCVLGFGILRTPETT